MSYSIFYDKQYIKLDGNKIIPFILGGDSNCYDSDNKRRSRDWSIYPYLCGENRYFTTPECIDEAINNKVRNAIESNINYYTDTAKNPTAHDIINNLGWYTALYIKGTSRYSTDEYKAYLLNPVKSALTFEDLQKHGISLRVNVYKSYYGKDTFSIPIPDFPVINSIKSFYTAVDMIKDFKANCIVTDNTGKTSTPAVYICFNTSDDVYLSRKFKQIRKEKKPVKIGKPKVIKPKTSVFVLESDRLGMLVKYTSRHIKYAPSYAYNISADGKSTFKTFDSQKKAVKYIDTLKAKKYRFAEEWKVTEIKLK